MRHRKLEFDPSPRNNSSGSNCGIDPNRHGGRPLGARHPDILKRIAMPDKADSLLNMPRAQIGRDRPPQGLSASMRRQGGQRQHREPPRSAPVPRRPRCRCSGSGKLRAPPPRARRNRYRASGNPLPALPPRQRRNQHHPTTPPHITSPHRVRQGSNDEVMAACPVGSQEREDPDGVEQVSRAIQPAALASMPRPWRGTWFSRLKRRNSTRSVPVRPSSLRPHLDSPARPSGGSLGLTGRTPEPTPSPSGTTAPVDMYSPNSEG